MTFYFLIAENDLVIDECCLILIGKVRMRFPEVKKKKGLQIKWVR